MIFELGPDIAYVLKLGLWGTLVKCHGPQTRHMNTVNKEAMSALDSTVYVVLLYVLRVIRITHYKMSFSVCCFQSRSPTTCPFTILFLYVLHLK